MAKRNTLTEKILHRLSHWAADRVFSRGDLLDLGSTDAIGMALMRLERRGKIRRVGRGFYDRPRTHPQIGPLSPSGEELARAMARKEGSRLGTSGAEAANLLRLSEQVPAKAVYLTDGRSRTIPLGKGTIRFRGRSPRTMARAGRMSGLVFTALRELGKKHVTRPQVQHLRKLLRKEDRRRLLKDIRYSPAWMHPHIRLIAGEQSS